MRQFVKETRLVKVVGSVWSPLISLLFVPLCLSADTPRPLIHFQSLAELSKSTVTVGDVAVIQGASAERTRRVSSLVLSRDLAAGSKIQWSAADITEKLHQNLSVLEDFKLIIPESIEVRYREPRTADQEIRSQLQDVVRVQLPEPTWEFDLSDIKIPPLLSGVRSDNLQVVPTLVRPKGLFSFEVLVQDKNKAQHLWIQARVRYFTQVATLMRQIPPQGKINSSDLRWERRDVTFQNDVPATSNEASRGVARITLIPGTVLLRSQLDREMALHFGEPVDLIAGDDALSVLTKGISQQNAYVGDKVRVKNTATNKVIEGVVVSPGVVSVTY